MSVQFYFILFIISFLTILFIFYKKYFFILNKNQKLKEENILRNKKELEEAEKNCDFKNKIKTQNIPLSSKTKQEIKKCEMLISYNKEIEAKIILTWILTENPEDFSVNFLLWKIEMKKENYKNALIFLNKAFSLNKTDYNLLETLAQCFFAIWKKIKAIEMYEYLFSLNKTKYELLKTIWNLYFLIWNTEKAEIYFLQFIEKDKKDVDVLFNLIDIYKKLNNEEKVLDFLEKIKKIKPYEKRLKNYL